MIDIIVFSAVGILAIFVAVWLLRPDLRNWIEQPKYRFLEQTLSYDRARSVKSGYNKARRSQ